MKNKIIAKILARIRGKPRIKCELFSRMYNQNARFLHPKKKCGFQFYNLRGVNMGLCRHQVEKIGFKKCWLDMVVLVKWKKENESK